MTPTAAASHLAGRACPCLHSAAWDAGPETAASRSLRGPFSVRARPHTSKCLTLSSSGSPSDLAGQRPEGPGNPAAATALQGLGPTLLGDSGGSHPKVGGVPEKGNPKPSQAADNSPVSRSTARFRFPAYPVGRPVPQPRGGMGISKAAKLQEKEVVARQPDYQVGQKLQFPAGSGAADDGCGGEPAGWRILRALLGWNVDRVRGFRCSEPGAARCAPHAVRRRAPKRESGRRAPLQLMHAFKTPEPADAMHR